MSDKPHVTLQTDTYERLLQVAAESKRSPEEIVESHLQRYFRMLDCIEDPAKFEQEQMAWLASRT